MSATTSRRERSRILRFTVPSREALEPLIAAGEPFPDRGGVLRVRSYRDVYYDTPDADLEHRGATVRLRIRDDGVRTLLVDVWEEPPAGGTRQRTESRVDRHQALVFAGDTDAARVVRSLVDPARLEPALELEVLRRGRRVRVGDGEPADVGIYYDHITVRRGDLALELQELELGVAAERAGLLDGVVERLESRHGLRVTLTDRVTRARELLLERQGAGLVSSIRAAREVVVLPLREGRLALLPGGDGLELPTGPGQGLQACREVLRTTFGTGQAQARVLDRLNGQGGMPALEIWLAEDVPAPRDEAAEQRPGVVWLEPEDVLARVGTPELLETRTLAALDIFVRRAADPVTLEGSPILRHTARRRDFVQQGAPEEDLKRPQPELPRGQLLNMELSRMSFDERILVMAEEERMPLLERVRFLSMFASRQDDFFMTRVGGFKDQLVSRRARRTLDGLTPVQQLHAIGIRARILSARAYRLWGQMLLPELREHGIRILHWDDLTDQERESLRGTYARHVEAVLTPLTSDPSHPFPHVRNLRPALAALLRLPESGTPRFAAIELPGELPRFIPIRDGRQFVPLGDVILAGLPEMYPGMEVIAAHAFRVTRSATVRLGGGGVQDVLQAVEEEVTRRPFRHAVRLEVEAGMPEEMVRILLRELRQEAAERVLHLGPEDVYTVDGPVDLAAIAEVAHLRDPELHFGRIERHDPLEGADSIFTELDRRDVLVEFPDDSFEATVARFLREAADDEAVASIKITLYRTDPSSPVVEALETASSRGKEVAVLVELKASFDETRNIQWARRLEAAGARVVFSPPKYKVHAKLALVVRQEDDLPRRYAYIGTGNLNAATAASYVDLGLLTADAGICEEVGDVFNLLTGFTPQQRFRHLLVAPFNMRPRFIELIEREIEHARAGRPAGIRAQMNGLSDRRMIRSLYRASRAGVPIEMAVREICCLRPGVDDLSANIRIVSLLGRFLQHARIYHFVNGGEDEYFIGSADWRPRNLLRRVELVTPVRDPAHRERLDALLRRILHDPEVWELDADGRFVRQQQVAGSALA